MKLGNSKWNEALNRAAWICECEAARCDRDGEDCKRSQRAHYKAEADTCRHLAEHIRAYMEFDPPPPEKKSWRRWLRPWRRWLRPCRDIRASAVEDVEIDLPKVTDGMLKRAKLQRRHPHG